ncbi:DUF1651 domain-containing protein [Synechococcus sp. BSF8S]|nr:DUF1651 domain-containing protein [Synechococcus sp. BSF8S]MBC1264348.1 DUF1651 domain-containing protein [Synechococcus sp. BSA11S]
MGSRSPVSLPARLKRRERLSRKHAVEQWQKLLKAGWRRVQPQWWSDHPMGLGAFTHLRQLLQQLPGGWPLFRVVDGGEGASDHACLDFLQGVGRVHQQLGGDVIGGERNRSGVTGDSVPRSGEDEQSWACEA